MKLKITKEKVLKASETCPDAKTILRELFPEVFAGEEVIKNDVTPELTFKANPFSPNEYYLDFFHDNAVVGYIKNNEIRVTNNNYECIECDDGTFRVVKR